MPRGAAAAPGSLEVSRSRLDAAWDSEGQWMVSLPVVFQSTSGVSIRYIIPLVNKTAHEAWGLFQDTNSSVQKVNASIPVLIKLAQPDIPLLHRGLKKLVELVLEVKAGTILTNLTQHVDISMVNAMNNIIKLHKQLKSVIKKPSPAKTVGGNVTMSLASRSQRNMDNAINPGFSEA
ncbi:multimerin-1-like [Passer domesticus]|uniref:multimerin-1-like n=1 Tax=Passer domesticus TaxID=48849 RepID=UPI0030FE66C7